MSDLLTVCSDPKTRYKNTFSNKHPIQPHYNMDSFTHREAYTPSESCVDSCKTAQVGTALFETCRTGSLAACSSITTDNIDQCFSDKCKYSELDSILNSWCSSNPNNVNYYKYCLDEQLPATILKTIQDLVTIDGDFIYYIKEGITVPSTAKTLYELVMAQTGFTASQLELLFNACNDSNSMGIASLKLGKSITSLGGPLALFNRWQTLYAAAKSISPLPKTSVNAFPGYNTEFVKKSTLVILNTPKGVLSIIGNFDFPYKARPVSLGVEDPFWAQLLISADIIIGKWFSYDFIKVQDSDAATALKILNPFIDMYEQYSIEITGQLSGANAVIATRTTDRAKFTTAMQKFVDNNILAGGSKFIDYMKTSICQPFADACFNYDVSLLKSGSFNDYANSVCDKATSTITGESNESYYTQDNSKTLKEVCALTYATAACKLPNYRYKSGFKDKPSIFESFSHKEQYEGENCIDACNTAKVGTPLFESCRIGAINACESISESNINQCFSDKCKYAELDTKLNAWCASNKSNAAYAKYCEDGTMPISTSSQSANQLKLATSTIQPTPPTIMTDSVVVDSPAAVTNLSIKESPPIDTTKSSTLASKSESTQPDHKSTDNTIIWVVIVFVAFVFIVAAGYFMYANQSGNSTTNRMVPFTRFGTGRMFSR